MKKVNIDLEKLYSSNEIARILGVSHVAVYKKIKAGNITAHKLGRNYIIKGKDLEEFLYPTSHLTDRKRKIIEQIVKKVVDEYGEALNKLAKE